MNPASLTWRTSTMWMGSPLSKSRRKLVIEAPLALREQGGRPVTPLVAFILLVGTTAAAMFHYSQAFYLGRGYTQNSFLFIPSDRFMDFFNDYARGQNYGFHESHTMDYSPFAHLLMKASTLYPPRPMFVVVVAIFLVAMVVCIIVFFGAREHSGMQRLWYVVVLTFCSYAVTFAIDRGNTEMLLFVLMFAYIWAYSAGRRRLAMVLLGAAIAFKLYPAVFLVLPLTDRRVRDAAWSFLVSIGLTIAGILGLWLTAHVAPLTIVRDWLTTLGAGHGAYAMAGFDPIRHRNSLWGVVHVVWLLTTGADPPGWGSTTYTGVAALAFLGISAFLVWRSVSAERAPALWRRVGVLTVCMLLLPLLSGDYALLFLYLPLMLLAVTGVERRTDIGVAVALSLALVPLDYVILRADTSISVLLYPALMLVALTLMLIDIGRTSGRPDVVPSVIEAPRAR